jgi:DNA-binding SARP family transcriptional activator
MEFRLLGEVGVETAGGIVRLSGRKQRGLFALLLLHNGELLSRDFLIDQLWDRPPADPPHALEGQVSRLRKTLRALDAAGDPIVQRAGGYVLEVEPERIDLGRARRLISEARRARTSGDEQTAVDRLSQALALWRGEPLPDLAYEPFALVELHHLEELRLAAVEELAEAQLALGRHGELIPELDSLLARHPLRERLRGALMLALYRDGRQADALECYREGRRLLVDELGIEPSESLQQLQHRILNHDATLAASGTAPREVTGSAPR